MPEHFLDAAQIGAAVEKIGREGMAHAVWRQGVIKPRLAHRRLEHLAHRIGLHLVAARRHEEIRALLAVEQLRARHERVSSEGVHGQIVQGNDALLRALAEQARLALVEVDVGSEQPRRLRDARTARVEEFKYRLVAHVGERLLAGAPLQIARSMDRQQACHIARAKNLREVFSALRPDERARRVGVHAAGDVQPAEKRAQRRKTAVDRPARIARRIELGQIAPQVPMACMKRIELLAISPPAIVP